MYNVLDKSGNKIKVEKIDLSIHKHISGRDFTSDELGIKTEKTPDIVIEKKPVSKKKTLLSKSK